MNCAKLFQLSTQKPSVLLYFNYKFEGVDFRGNDILASDITHPIRVQFHNLSSHTRCIHSTKLAKSSWKESTTADVLNKKFTAAGKKEQKR